MKKHNNCINIITNFVSYLHKLTVAQVNKNVQIFISG
jgi:hypothetical protein